MFEKGHASSTENETVTVFNLSKKKIHLEFVYKLIILDWILTLATSTLFNKILI